MSGEQIIQVGPRCVYGLHDDCTFNVCECVCHDTRSSRFTVAGVLVVIVLLVSAALWAIILGLVFSIIHGL